MSLRTQEAGQRLGSRGEDRDAKEEDKKRWADYAPCPSPPPPAPVGGAVAGLSFGGAFFLGGTGGPVPSAAACSCCFLAYRSPQALQSVLGPRGPCEMRGR